MSQWLRALLVWERTQVQFQYLVTHHNLTPVTENPMPSAGLQWCQEHHVRWQNTKIKQINLEEIQKVGHR